ncbi:peptide/nickel transport system substrate-binding protein [Peribacillus huizhouensis]|uniref:Peptide/nickel transport system substrate-binding protein n=2 Tax=Peribacillus huizhouensis TaxID=1501239 RepID=A0ABR6CJK5_9BACI|nr:oligopeptide ABC transporter substrate-binding protein [Peribacillus huizhouensis]MBA9025091.1 peptide/nickel transport system substrate-binding protein [Peribacillus huizhouensis]
MPERKEVTKNSKRKKEGRMSYKGLCMLIVSVLSLTAFNTNHTIVDGKKHGILNNTNANTTNLFTTVTTNSKPAIKNGHLNYGLSSDTPFTGILSHLLYTGNPDSLILQFFDESLLQSDENYTFNNEGAATYEMSDDNKTITLTIKDHVKWHDGAPVTGSDLEYAFLVIGNPDYTGVRYDKQMQMVKGMEEYHKGKVDYISGIKVDGKKISITFKEANPSILTGGVWTYPMHKEYLKDVAIGDLESSDKIRKTPIGFGPFQVKKIIPGEAVEFVSNDEYWQGKPQLGSISLKVINPDLAVKAIETGELDIVEISADQYDQAKNLQNIETLGYVGFAYSYIGFKLGHFDPISKTTKMDNPKMANINLRQALAYAIDNKAVGEKIYKGLRFPANTVIPAISHYHNSKIKGYSFNQQKSKRLLDDAGYIDTDGDGIREDLKGKKFTIYFASMNGDANSELLAQYYIQQWGDIGLDVQLVDGRLQEFNSFYDMVALDDPKIDIFQAAWQAGSDPDPSGIWDKNSDYNYTRWVNQTSQDLLAKGLSPKAFDKKYRKEVYDEWQQLVHDEVPMIPTLFRYNLAVANLRIKDFDYKFTDWSKVAVTAEDAVR